MWRTTRLRRTTFRGTTQSLPAASASADADQELIHGRDDSRAERVRARIMTASGLDAGSGRVGIRLQRVRCRFAAPDLPTRAHGGARRYGCCHGLEGRIRRASDGATAADDTAGVALRTWPFGGRCIVVAHSRTTAAGPAGGNRSSLHADQDGEHHADAEDPAKDGRSTTHARIHKWRVTNTQLANRGL